MYDSSIFGDRIVSVKSHSRNLNNKVASVKKHSRKVNAGLQEYILRKKIKSMGYDPDLYDVHAKMDRTLTLNENLSKLKSDVSILNNRYGLSSGGRVGNVDRYSDSRDLFDSLSLKRRITDSLKQAKTTFDVDELNKLNFKKWLRTPNKYDIMGVDSKY